MAGADDLATALRQIAERARADGGRAAAAAMGNEGERAIKVRLSRYSHSRGTVTPSPPGQPPAIITGTLRRSVIGEGPREEGAGRWVMSVRPTTVYAPIQEKGGLAGRHHRTRLPARPYVAPSVRDLEASGRLQDAAAEAFRRAVGL